ncbi:hypothetical protein [Curtobacterium phage Parvaparticeps]|nr:hypothetical protein [Curtobacterium phage Parvaparticeps]
MPDPETPEPEVIEFPEDVYVYTDSDELDTTSATVANGTGDQTGGLGPL